MIRSIISGLKSSHCSNVCNGYINLSKCLINFSNRPIFELIKVNDEQKRKYCINNSTQTNQEANIPIFQNIYGTLRRPKAVNKKVKERDRRVPVSLEESMKYLESQTYKNTYGDYKVWQLYRRNHPKSFTWVPFITRENCIGNEGYIEKSNPCPICRDKYLLVHYKNLKLLKQFIDPLTDEPYTNRRVNLCQVKYEELLVAIYIAKDYGLLPFHIEKKIYNYDEYYHKKYLSDIKEISIEDPTLLKLELYPNWVENEPEHNTFPNIFPDSEHFFK